MGRASKRAGFGVQRGSINPRITVSNVAPSNPKTNDIWVNTTTPTAPVWNYYDGANWQN